MSRTIAAAAAALALALVPAAGRAQQPKALQKGKEQQSQPVVFVADEIRTDRELGLIVARGHVEIAQGNTRLLADTVTYNQRTDTITASGHVSLLEPTGEILSANFVELTNQLNEGFAQDIRVLLTDRSRLAANTGRRTGGVETELRRAVYSPCELCRADPTRPPLWQLKAAKVTHDETQHIVEYRDAVLEIEGIPVFYTPYLSHPDPTVKRKSGFLAPTIGNSTSLGSHITIPYFWNIAPDRDFTFAPMFTTEGGQVAAGEYRQRFSNGELSASGSITESDIQATRPDGSTFPRDAVRGHLFTRGRFDLTDEWRTGWDINRSTDQTYLRRYRYGGTESFLVSNAFAETFEPRTYGAVNAYAFQALRQGVEDKHQPYALPVAEYDWVGLPGDFGGRWRATASMANLFREEGTDSRRISVGTEWQAPYIGALGEVYTFTASLRGDAYYSNDVIDFRNGQPRDGGFDGRLFPQLAAEVHWPWVREGQHWSQLIEPIAAVIVAPTGLNHPDIPNEDSIAFDFDETDLFVRNRLPGYDRVDEGQRVDYGLRAAIYGDSGGSSSLLIGQSYRLQRDTTAFPTGSGLDDHFSDIVGRVVVSPNSLLDLAYRFRLDKDQITTVRRQEVSATGGPESLRLGISYLDIPGQTGAAANPALQQVSASVTAALTRYWTVGLATTRNLNGGTEDISSSLTATYRDECLAFIASITQSGTSDRDLRPGTSVLFTLVLKNLGEIGGRVFEESGSSQ